MQRHSLPDEHPEAVLRRVFDAYESAYRGRDPIKIAEARIALVQALQNQDWIPPEEVSEQLQRDASALRRRAETRPE